MPHLPAWRRGKSFPQAWLKDRPYLLACRREKPFPQAWLKGLRRERPTLVAAGFQRDMQARS
jgi:hypothetical protein